MTLILWAALIALFVFYPWLLVVGIPLGLFYVFADWHRGTADANPDRHNRTL